MRHPNAYELAMRDPATAALFGAFPTADFGVEGGFGGEFAGDFGGEFGGEPPYFGVDPLVVESNRRLAFPQGHPGFGHPYGHPGYGHHMMHHRHPGFIAPPGAPAPAAPSPAEMAAWQDHMDKRRHHQSRERMLDPNEGSAVKIEGYEFSLNQALTLGTPSSYNVSLQPNATIRPTRFVVNAPAPYFLIMDTLQVANVSALLGSSADAWNYNPQSFGRSLDLPKLTPANRATVAGNYTGFVPAALGFVTATPFTAIFTFIGPANIVG